MPVTTGGDTVMTIWPEKVKATCNAQQRLNVYFTISHLIWCKSHAYLLEEKKGRTEKQRLSCATKTPWGLCIFLVFQGCAAIRPRVWPWLLNSASPTQPQFKTRGWEACSSLTQFSQFSAWLWWETYESMLCAILKGWVHVESPSQMALCQATTAAPDSHRWRTQEGKWQWGLSEEPSLSASFWTWREDRFCFHHVCQCHFDACHLMFVHFICVHACCVSLLTCCHDIAQQTFNIETNK